MSNHYIKGQNYYFFFFIFRDNEKSRQIAEKQITWRFGSSTVPPWQMVKSAPWVSDIFFLGLSFSWYKLSLNFWNSRNFVSLFDCFRSVFCVCEMWTVESAKFYAPYFAVFQHDFFPPAEWAKLPWIYTQQMFHRKCVSKIAALLLATWATYCEKIRKSQMLQKIKINKSKYILNCFLSLSYVYKFLSN